METLFETIGYGLMFLMFPVIQALAIAVSSYQSVASRLRERREARRSDSEDAAGSRVASRSQDRRLAA